MKKQICIIGILIITTLFMFATGCEKSPEVFPTDPPPLSGVYLEYISHGEEAVTVKWVNNSDKDINFGRSGQLLKENNGNWEYVGGLSQNKGIMILEAGQSIELNYAYYECDTKATGKYRVSAVFNYADGETPSSDPITVDFEVK